MYVSYFIKSLYVSLVVWYITLDINQDNFVSWDWHNCFPSQPKMYVNTKPTQQLEFLRFVLRPLQNRIKAIGKKELISVTGQNSYP